MPICGSVSLIDASASRGGFRKLWLSCASAWSIDVEILVQDHDHREAADVGLGIDELVELGAVLVEHRLGARQLDRGPDDVGAHDLGMLANIGLGDDHRVFDQRLGLLGKQAIEPAVERDARHHGDQNRRHRRDQRKQRNDTHVQPCRGPPTPACLQDAPDFPPDERQQKKDRERVHQQEREDDLVGRQNRREVGEDHESRERRQQRHRHRDRADKPRQPTGRRRRGGREFGRSDLADVRHEVESTNRDMM